MKMACGMFILLFCTWLALSSGTVQVGEQISTPSVPVTGEQRSLMGELLKIQEKLSATQTSLQRLESGYGFGACAVVTKQGVELSSLLARQQALESELRASQAELNAANTVLRSQVQALQSDLRVSQTELKAARTALGTKVQALEGDIEATASRLKGSSFVRWGRTSCPSNATLVYTGIIGGKNLAHKGSGTNLLCLPWSPQFDAVVSIPPSYGFIFGAEYQEIPGHTDHDVPCSVCQAPQSTTIMVPATLTCPSGWAPQYTGHLISANDGHYATEFVCLDERPENSARGGANTPGVLLYHVTGQCGTLPCPPYVHNKVLTCAVCSHYCMHQH